MKRHTEKEEVYPFGIYRDLLRNAFPFKRTVRLNRFDIALKEYEVIISERSYVKGTDLSTRYLRRVLKWLEDNGHISLNPTNKGTIVKINNPEITADNWYNAVYNIP